MLLPKTCAQLSAKADQRTHFEHLPANPWHLRADFGAILPSEPADKLFKTI